MPWFLFAILGYFLMALVGVIDKFLLAQRPTTKPAVYTFYVGLLSIFALVLAPFGFSWPGFGQFLISMLAGGLFIFGLLYLFRALDIGSASRVLAAFGGLTPILILSLSYLFLGERLGGGQFFAFFLLVSGSVLISSEKEPMREQRRRFRFIGLAIALTAVSLVLTKYIFLRQNFFSGFVWMRIGSFLAAILFLIPAKLRRSIFDAGRQSKSGISLLLVSNKGLAGMATVMVNYAISLASVSIVNALQGIQYAFLLLLTAALSKKFPHILKEKITPAILVQKISAIVLIAAGLVILVI
jgi:drug/metabolite transporter (DMT)-like permease